MKIKRVIELGGEIEEVYNELILDNFIGKVWFQKKIIQLQYPKKKITQ